MAARCGSPGSTRRNRTSGSTGSPRPGPGGTSGSRFWRRRRTAGDAGSPTSRARDGGWLSDDLLRAGLARVKPEFETRNCEAARLEVEQAALGARLGVWAVPGAVFSADDSAALVAAEGRLVVVEGKVQRVGVGRSRVYLDFGGRGGFTVVALRKAEAAFQRSGRELTALSGTRLCACVGILMVDLDRGSSLPILS